MAEKSFIVIKSCFLYAQREENSNFQLFLALNQLQFPNFNLYRSLKTYA